MNRFMLIGCLLILMNIAVTAVEGASMDRQYIRQIITADNNTSRTISWQSNKFTPYPVLEYKKVNSKKIFRERGMVKSIATPKGTVFIYTVNLARLRPGVSYEYRVGSVDEWSDWLILKMAQKDKCKALIFGDSQSSDHQVWKTTATKAFQQNHDADFFINMGDLVDNGESWYQWEQWLIGAKSLAEQIPAAPLSGNHEDYSLAWQFTLPRTYLNLFALPDNGAAGLAGQSYSYDYGPVHFAVLDTQALELNEYYPDLFERQALWLKQDLAATKKTWKVVLMHRPAYGLLNGEEGNLIGATFMPLFERFDVDVVLQGHLHCYSRSVPIRQGKASSTGPVYICTGRSGDDVWLENHRQSLDDIFIDLPDKPNYLTLIADKNKLSIACFAQDGDLLDSFVLNKNKKRQP